MTTACEKRIRWCELNTCRSSASEQAHGVNDPRVRLLFRGFRPFKVHCVNVCVGENIDLAYSNPCSYFQNN